MGIINLDDFQTVRGRCQACRIRTSPPRSPGPARALLVPLGGIGLGLGRALRNDRTVDAAHRYDRHATD